MSIGQFQHKMYCELNICMLNLQEKNAPELYAKNVQLVLAKALEIPATDITYRKYYAEYCVMHDTMLHRGNKEQEINDIVMEPNSAMTPNRIHVRQ